MEAEEDKSHNCNLESLELTAPTAPPPRKKHRNAAVVIGNFVRKNFPGDGPGAPPTPLLGKVLSCCGRQYTIVFEDGRREALNLPETRQILLPSDEPHEEPQRRKQLERLWRFAADSNAPRTRSRKAFPDAAKPSKKEDDGDGAMTEASDPVVEVAASSSTVPISNLDDEDPDSCSDSCDSSQARVSAEEDATADWPPLPPSSGDVDVPDDAIFHLFNVYSFLRSFSRQLFLSPFAFEEFVGAVNCRSSNNLLDAVHLSVLRALRRQLVVLESDGSKLACMCLKCVDWNLLDVMTWPIFVVRYFWMFGHTKEVDGEALLAGALEGEYYGLPPSLKLAVLQILCDDVLESPEFGTELAMRENMDEEKEFDVNSEISSLDSGPMRVHPRYAKTSACKNPGYLEETITTGELISSSKGVETDAKDVGVLGLDGNSDDCRLCGMEGTLVCCDGCPSAYHSRCIGLNKTSLPDGPWFCPECMVKKTGMASSRVSFGIRGAELFGSDPFGRTFFGSCDYLLVLENLYKGSYVFRYYNRGDITKVLQVLHSTRESSFYAGITRAISTYWEIPLAFDHFEHFRGDGASLTVDKGSIVCSSNRHIFLGKPTGEDQEGNNQISQQKGGGQDKKTRTTICKEDREAGIATCKEDREAGIASCKKEGPEPSPQDGSCPNASFVNGTSVLMDANSLGTESIFNCLSSEKSLGDLEKKPLCLHHKAFEDTSSVVRNDHQLGDEPPKSVGVSNLSSDVYIGDSTCGDDGLTASPVVFKPFEYINLYIPGEFAASAAANFAIVAAERNKVLETNPSAKDRKNLTPIAALQLKSFCEASMHFMWPGTDKKMFDGLRERCGWCLACEAAATCKKGCLLNTALINNTRGYSKSLGNFRPLKNGSHTSSIATYILYMEACLGGLLEGQFLDAYHNVQWRKIVSEASTVQMLKYLLLDFVKNIRAVVFSNDWFKPVDDWLSGLSNSESNASITASSQKRCLRGRRGRKRAALTESNHSDSDDDRGQIQWWCGGLSKSFLRGGSLPAVLAKKSARQAGTRGISDVFYNLKMPSTTRNATWRAAVEMSKNYSQLAFQVRYLDSHIRWKELSRPELTTFDGKGVDIEASVFRNAGIIDEKVVGNQTRYALAFGDQKHLPSRILKNVLETEQSINGERMWFSEFFLPLYLIKEYEENKVTSHIPSLSRCANRLSIIPPIHHNDVQEDIFSYLFNKGEKPVKSSCSSCKRDVSLRQTLKCETCGGPCHKNCLQASATDMKTWMCTTCYNANPPKKDADSSNARVPSTKNQITPQLVQMTPEAKIRDKPTFGSSRKPVNSEEISEMRSASANKSSKRKNHNKCLSHGLIWKGRRGGTDSCDPDFHTKNIILKGDVEMGNLVAPKCKLCTLPYNPNLMYIRCEKCKYWYHAESVELEEHQIAGLAGFKCPTCRRRCSPTCPYADPNRKRQMKRNDTDGRQRKAALIESQSSSEPPESVFAVQYSQADTVVPPERIEQASTLMSEAPVDWSLPKATLGSKGKLPVRRNASNDIPTEAETGHPKLLEEKVYAQTEINQDVDLQGFSSIQKANSTVGLDTIYLNADSHHLTAGGGNMDANEIDGYHQVYDSNGATADGMQYEPQTYFSFTELLASGNEPGEEMFDVDIPVEVPYDWQSPDSWDPYAPSGVVDDNSDPQVPPGYAEPREEQLECDDWECQKCGSRSPPPDLCCEICGLTIHSHCSPWVEMEQAEDSGGWRCGGCREWR